MTTKKILVTGGCGFIGCNLIRYILRETDNEVLNLDNLTYAGNLENIGNIARSKRLTFKKIDITDSKKVSGAIHRFQPDIIMHLAAETHVDRSIEGPLKFINTNIFGTFNLLEASKNYYSDLSQTRKSSFRFHHISTDEVYGDLRMVGNDEPDVSRRFTETTPYKPSSPYSASKASSDHLVRAWHRTYKLPILISNCSNNYGPFQHSEKLIPKTIRKALLGEKIPIYGSGLQVRDWLYVEDHVAALYLIATQGHVGETYNVGGWNEVENIVVAQKVCAILQNKKPIENRYENLIEFVSDRPGHDERYAIDASKIEKELGWRPVETFSSGLEKTVSWYLKNYNWMLNITS